MDAELAARLDQMDAKLDYIVDRQRFVEELIREMTPVGREALTSMAAQLAELEEKGWFDMGAELFRIVDNLAASYTPEDVRELADSMVGILDTVRNVAQPDVLELANEATDVIHHADEVEPVGAWGMAKAVGDADVQRGMAVGLEILRHLGRARSHVAERPARVAAPRRAPSRTEGASAPEVELGPIGAQPKPEVVEWMGRRFDPNGFLLDADQWDEELAAAMANGLGITLSEDHWTVLRWARAEYASSNASPNVRKLAAGSGVGVKRMYELFPKTPGKSAAMIAGIPKPVGCL